MLSKCANPECHAVFRFLHEGRLFTHDRRASGAEGGRAIERYWLCDDCVRTMTLRLEGGQVVARPMRMPVRRITAMVDAVPDLPELAHTG
jgi:hypothetical protein